MMIDDRRTNEDIRAEKVLESYKNALRAGKYTDTHMAADSEFTSQEKALIDMKKAELGLF